MKHADLIKRLIKEALSKPLKEDTCNCGCHSCDNVGNKGPVLNESLGARILMTENMQYHVKNKLAITENTFRYGSQAFLDLWAEARYLYSRNAIHLNDEDKEIILETNLGEYGMFEGKKVALDIPMLEDDALAADEEEIADEPISEDSSIGGKKDTNYPIPFRALSDLTKVIGEKIQQLNKEEEAKGIYFTGDLALLDKKDQVVVQEKLRMLNLLRELDRLFSFENKTISYNTLMSILKKYDATDLLASVGAGLNESKDKKNPPLNKPKRGGSKKFYVYVRDKGKIKKVSFGDTSGLSAKINNPQARKAFAARHDCANKKDKTKASYWSCRLPRYAKLLGIKSTFSGYW